MNCGNRSISNISEKEYPFERDTKKSRLYDKIMIIKQIPFSKNYNNVVYNVQIHNICLYLNCNKLNIREGL